MLADFLMSILKWYPKDRPSAREMISHPWLTMPDDYDYKMKEKEYKVYELKEQTYMMDNYDCDFEHIVGYKNILMNPNIQHNLQLDFRRLEAMIRQRKAEAGL